MNAKTLFFLLVGIVVLLFAAVILSGNDLSSVLFGLFVLILLTVISSLFIWAILPIVRIINRCIFGDKLIIGLVGIPAAYVMLMVLINLVVFHNIDMLDSSTIGRNIGGIVVLILILHFVGKLFSKKTTKK